MEEMKDVPAGYRVYHRDDAGAPELHTTGDWYFEPVGYDAGEVYSGGHDTQGDAIDACIDWVDGQAVESGEDDSGTPLTDALNAAIAARDAAKSAYDAPEAGRDGPEWDRYSDAYDAVEAAKAALAASDELRMWTVREDGEECYEIEACSAADGLDEARSNVDRANYDGAEGTIWVDVDVRCEATDEEASGEVVLDEDEPECDDGGSHDWQCPHEIVGGLEENPGVWGHGGGVRITRVCMRCGCGQHTDTWAQRPDNGVQGYTTVRYEPGEFACEVRGES